MEFDKSLLGLDRAVKFLTHILAHTRVDRNDRIHYSEDNW
jgi:hypothetical protein